MLCHINVLLLSLHATSSRRLIECRFLFALTLLLPLAWLLYFELLGYLPHELRLPTAVLLRSGQLRTVVIMMQRVMACFRYTSRPFMAVIMRRVMGCLLVYCVVVVVVVLVLLVF